jgi:hypothetical protein
MTEKGFWSGRLWWEALLMCACIGFVLSCGSQTGKRATQGAAGGAIAGAAGGVVSALIFGGDVGDAAARGAAWGASTGAVSGAIAGSQEDRALKKRQQDDAVKKLKKALGDDAYDGLMALVQCKHPVAMGYAETAQNSRNTDYVLAGLWLEVIALADKGAPDQAQAMLPAIVKADPEVSVQSEAETRMQKALQGLTSIRKQHNLPQTCP